MEWSGVLKVLQNPHLLLTFDNMQNPLRLPRKTISQRPKCSAPVIFVTRLTSKCASRHNGMHFFDMSTSKSGPSIFFTSSRHIGNGVHFFIISTSKSGLRPSVFYTFGLEMRFASQRRAFFQHLNFQKAVRRWCVLYILTWNCASRDNGVQFFISHLARWLRTDRFSKPTF